MMGSAVTSPHALQQEHHCSLAYALEHWKLKQQEEHLASPCGTPAKETISERAKIIF